MSPTAPPAPPAQSNYDAPGPPANTATPVPAPDPVVHARHRTRIETRSRSRRSQGRRPPRRSRPPSTRPPRMPPAARDRATGETQPGLQVAPEPIDEAAEEQAAAAEAAAIGGSPGEPYAGSEPGEPDHRGRAPARRGGRGRVRGPGAGRGRVRGERHSGRRRRIPTPSARSTTRSRRRTIQPSARRPRAPLSTEDPESIKTTTSPAAGFGRPGRGARSSRSQRPEWKYKRRGTQGPTPPGPMQWLPGPPTAGPSPSTHATASRSGHRCPASSVSSSCWQAPAPLSPPCVTSAAAAAEQQQALLRGRLPPRPPLSPPCVAPEPVVEAVVVEEPVVAPEPVIEPVAVEEPIAVEPGARRRRGGPLRPRSPSWSRVLRRGAHRRRALREPVVAEEPVAAPGPVVEPVSVE